MERYSVQRRRTRRLEARALSSRACVLVMFVDRTDRIFSNDAVEELSFYRGRNQVSQRLMSWAQRPHRGLRQEKKHTFQGHSETIFAGAPECRGTWRVSSLLRAVLAQRREVLRR